METGEQRVALFGVAPAFHAANIREFEGEKARRNKSSAIECTRHFFRLWFPNKSAASAEAPTALTAGAGTVGTDQWVASLGVRNQS